MRVNLTNDDPFRRWLMEGEAEGGSAAADGGEAKPEGGEAAKAEGGEGGEGGGDAKPAKRDWRDRKMATQYATIKSQERELANLRTLVQNSEKAAAKVEGGDGGGKGAEKLFTEAEVEEISRQRARNAAQASEFERQCNTAVDKGKAAYGDFTEVMGNYRNFGGVDGLEAEHGLISQILDTDKPEKVLYDLAKDPETLDELLGLSPNKRMARLAKMAEDKTPAAKQQSKVPPPPSSVKGGDAPVVDPLDMRNDTDSWIKSRQEKVEKSGNRRLIGAGAMGH